MDEENKDNKINKDEILKETSDTINEVKDQVKGTFKKDELKNNAKETKNFITGMFKDPIGELKNIAEDNSNSTFKYAIILIIIWVLAVAILKIFTSINSWNILKYILPLIKVMIAPILAILTASVILMVMNKKKDKSLVTIISVVTAARLPKVISAVVSLLRVFSSKITTITSPFSTFCTAISTILLYFGCKFVLGEDDDKKFIKTFIIIEGIYYIAYIAFYLLDIYI